MLTNVSRRLAGLAIRLESAGGARRALVSALAGAASAIAFAPFHVAIALFVTLPVLFWLASPPPAARAENARESFGEIFAVALHPTVAGMRQGFVTGWWFGFGFHFAGLYWIGGAFLVQAETFAWLLPFAILAMPAGLAIFHGLAMALVANVVGGVGGRLAVFAIALAASEWLRGNILTGFPWNTLGYALTGPPLLMQAVAVVGIYGLTLAAVFIFAAPAAFWAESRRSLTLKQSLVLMAALALAPAVIIAGYGTVALTAADPGDVPGVRVRLVQPSIAQRDKFEPAKRRAIFERHLALSRLDPRRQQGSERITHVIWPEAALAFLALRTPEVLAGIARVLPDDVTLIAGTLRLDGELVQDGRRHRVFNAAMVVGGDGRILNTYDKVHLVPFGEYLPQQDLLEAIGLEQLTRIRGGFTPGDGTKSILDIPGLPAARILICYEVIFPREVVSGDRRPGVLVNLTNDAWYGPTSGPYQHFQQSVVRAAEYGLPLVRVANNGISAVIDARGRILKRLQLDAVAVLDARLPAALPPTIYARWGDLIFAMMWLSAVLIITIISCRQPSSLN